MRSIVLLFIFIVSGLPKATPQDGLDGIIVERYYVWTGEESLEGENLPPAGSVTYRVYVDMEPGFSLQMVFGFKNSPLMISTTTGFYNDVDFGDVTADRIRERDINTGAVSLDSWLTMGFGSNHKVGVLKEIDEDGSIINALNLGDSDGLIEGSGMQTVMYRLSTDFVNIDGAPSFTCDDCAWANMGGLSGPDPENRVLIGQFTTDGVLSLQLNVQIGGGKDCEPVQFVAKEPMKGQILHSSLIYNMQSTDNSQ